MQALQHRTTRGGGTGASTVPAASGLALETGTIKGNVPQFLAKLWNMVNDPTTDHLIKWADDGRSFYVLDQDRFAKEILGNFYKTENVQSFVRQLNMYGFHKIQHIRQGAMRSSKESQAWQFTNPNFQRGQPDLLCLIARKHKHPDKGNALIVSSTGATIEPIEGPDGERDQLANGEVAVTGKANGQLDVQGVISGLAAIKRHQAVISATLKEVQQSNSALWQEAMEARERHRKHQDTINRILKFLASLYQHPSGSPGGAVGVTSGAGKDSVGVVPRPRLMITDSAGASKSTKQEGSTPMTTNSNGVQLEEIELLGDDIPASSTPLPYAGLSPTVETPGPFSSLIESVSNTVPLPNESLSAPASSSSTNGQQSQSNATPSTGLPANARPMANPDAWNPAWNPALIQNLLQMNPQLWNGMQNKAFQLPLPPQPQLDNSMALTQMHQAQNNMAMSASAIQQLLQGLGPYFPAAAASNPNLNKANNQQLVNGNAFNNIFDPTALSTAMDPTTSQPTISNLNDLILPPTNDPQLPGLMLSSQQLSAINEGVAHVDEHINNLINAMPVDPAVASSFRSGQAADMISMPPTGTDVNGIHEAMDDDVDLDAFWRQLGFGPGFGSTSTNLPASTTTDADIDPALFLESLPQPQDGLPPGGFLDEVTTSPLLPSNASDVTMADSLALPGVAGSASGGERATRKRKSDAAGLSPTATTAQKTTGSRTKRKR